jgi:hypothetical protein
MSKENPIPLTIPSGVVRTRSGEGAKGRWFDARNMRFEDGKPVKRAGYERLNSTPFEGRARGMLAWNTVKGNPLYALGTNLRLYGSTDGVDIKNITPLRFTREVVDAFSVAANSAIVTFKHDATETGELTDPFTTTNGSPTVTVAHEAHGHEDGDKVAFSGATAVGGLTLNGVYAITVVDADSYTITHTSNASSAATGGGTVTYKWPLLEQGQTIRFYGNAFIGGTIVGGLNLEREYEVLSVESGDTYKLYSAEAQTILTDPFTTVSSNKTVTVTDVEHGKQTGQKVYFRDATAVGGQTVSGEYTITVVDDDTYTIQIINNASSAATGGGTVRRSFGDHATAAATDGGGRVNYLLRVEDPFSVSEGYDVLIVTHPGHGALYNDLVVISDADPVGGVDPNGERRILEVVDENSYKVRLDEAATSTDTGGGARVLLEYEISTGPLDRVLAKRGYGKGSYGLAAYGTTNLNLDPVYYEPRSWSLSKAGEDMIAGVMGGEVYYWDSSEGQRAEIIPNAPRNIRYAFQTEERMLHVLGIEGDPLKFGWSDQDEVNNWEVLSTTTANVGRRVGEGSVLVAGTPVAHGVNLIWTDTATYVHQYTGSRFIYDTRLASQNAGLIGPHAFAITPAGVFWMGQNKFHMWNGAVSDVPRSEEIEEWVYAQIVTEQKSKCWAHYDVINNSIDFYFVPNGRRELLPDGESVAYVTLNLKDFSWCPGEEARTTGATFNTGSQNPYRAALDGYVYQHEVGLDANGSSAPCWIELAPIDLDNGRRWMDVYGLDPNMKRQVGPVDVLVRSYDRSEKNIIETEAATFEDDEEIVDLRVSGRRASVRFSQDVYGGDMAIDTPLILVQHAGKQR